MYSTVNHDNEKNNNVENQGQNVRKKKNFKIRKVKKIKKANPTHKEVDFVF